MTRKDYILIAEALRDKRNCMDGADDVNGRMYETFWDTTERICGALYRDNPRFDREHFLAVVRGEKELNSRPARRRKWMVSPSPWATTERTQ